MALPSSFAVDGARSTVAGCVNDDVEQEPDLLFVGPIWRQGPRQGPRDGSLPPAGKASTMEQDGTEYTIQLVGSGDGAEGPKLHELTAFRPDGSIHAMAG